MPKQKATPRKKNPALDKEVKLPESVPKPASFLELQGQFFPYCQQFFLERQNEADKGQPFPAMKAAETKENDLVYAVFSMEEDEEGEEEDNSCYLGKVVYSGPKGTRIRFVDAHKHSGAEQADNKPYNDFTPDSVMYLVRRAGAVGGPEAAWERELAGMVGNEDALKYLKSNATIKKQIPKEGGCDKRLQILAGAIQKLSNMERVTAQDVFDVYRKEVEEVEDCYKDKAPEQGNTIGQEGINIKIIQGFFDRPKDGAPEVVPESKMESMLKEVMVRLASIEDKIHKGDQVNKVAEKIAQAAKEKALPVEQPVEVVSMPGDGKCLYWFLAAIEAISNGKKVSEIKYDNAALARVKSQILRHSIALGEQMEGRGEDSKAAWFNMVGESVDDFGNKLMNLTSLGQEERYGGYVEALLYAWRTNTALQIINVDAITADMSEDQARLHVIANHFPEDSRDNVTHAAIALCSKKHYFLLAQGDKAIFEIGDDYQAALTKCMAEIKKQVATRPNFEDLTKITDKTKQMELINDRMAAPPWQLKTKKYGRKSSDKKGKPKPDSSSADGGIVVEDDDHSPGESGGPADTRGAKRAETDWSEVANRNGWGRKKPKVIKQTTSPTIEDHNAVVIYTQASADELMGVIATYDEEFASVVTKTRQKEGHVVLMSSGENVKYLKDSVEWLKDMGFQAKEYRFSTGTLADSAARGLKAKSMEAGVCKYFFGEIECPHRGRCRFKCYDKG